MGYLGQRLPLDDVAHVFVFLHDDVVVALLNDILYIRDIVTGGDEKATLVRTRVGVRRLLDVHRDPAIKMCALADELDEFRVAHGDATQAVLQRLVDRPKQRLVPRDALLASMVRHPGESTPTPTNSADHFR